MSRLVKHESCPNCGSRDNVGVYSDGHKWCFTPCGYYVAADGLNTEILQQKLKQKEKEFGTPISLPDDFQYSIPSEPAQWIKSYGITQEEIIKNRIGWSSEYNGIIFPVFDLYGNLLLYQRRRWPEKDFHTEGRPELVDFISGEQPGLGGSTGNRTICAVEDYLSTIKVARHVPTLCLWGSSLSSSRIRRLANHYSRLIIWLDRDKTNYALKRKLYAEPFFDEVVCRSTALDPKALPDSEIAVYVS